MRWCVLLCELRPGLFLLLLLFGVCLFRSFSFCFLTFVFDCLFLFRLLVSLFVLSVNSFGCCVCLFV